MILPPAAAQAQQALKVVEETYRTTQLDVEIAKTQLDKAQNDYNRHNRLHEEHAVSDNALESFELALDKAQKSYEKAEAVLSIQI